MRLFWIRRWLRTLPSYYAFMLPAAGVATTLKMELPNLVPYLAFAQNLAWPMPFYYHESWSLATVEVFYLVFPLLLMATGGLRMSPGARFLLCGAGIFLASLTLRTAAVIWLDPAYDLGVRKIAAFRLDTIMIGVLAYYADRRLGWSGSPALLWVGLGLLAISAMLLYQPIHALDVSVFARTILFDVEAAGFACILLAGLRRGIIATWLQPIGAMARWSYAAYLLNIPVSVAIWSLIDPSFIVLNPTPVFLAFWLITLTLAALIHRYFERPIMRWRDRAFSGEQVSLSPRGHRPLRKAGSP